MDALKMAYAVEYAKALERQKQMMRRPRRKEGWMLLFWFIGIGF